MFILFRQDPFSDGPMGLRVYFEPRGVGNGTAGSAKQKSLRRAVGKAGNSLQVKAFGKWLK